jgi:hypothetical protein
MALDLCDSVSSYHCLLVDRHWTGKVGHKARVSLRKMVDISHKLDGFVLRGAGVAGCFDLHESFNGQ